MTGDGELAVVAFFRAGNGFPIEPGGVALYQIETATGALTMLESVNLDGPGRVALTVTAVVPPP